MEEENHKHILVLIIEQFNNTISVADNAILQNWVSGSQENKQTYQKYIKALVLATDLELSKQIDKDKAWSIINSHTSHRNHKKLILNRILRYAAAILLPVIVGGLVYYFIQFNEKNVPIDDTYAQLEAIKPGTKKAVLTLGDGQTILLENKVQNKVLLKSRMLEIKDSSNIIVYKSKSQELGLKNHSVYVPKGGEYKVILSDGTNVWLNSDTKFDFPIKFSGSERIVSLQSGEAYFEVVENKLRPFIVKTDGMDVKVLGTSFNISAYKNDGQITTTLIEGQVKVISPPEEMVLHPGYQSQFSPDGMVLKKVDPELYIQWKEGLFRFENISLYDLTKRLGRWYSVDFFFDEDFLKEIKFNGAVRKDKPLSSILTILKETNHIAYEVNGDSITIKKNS